MIVKSMGHSWKYITFLAVASGCYSDFGIRPIVETPSVPENAPDIIIFPNTIDFGSLNANGERSEQEVIIGNKGDDVLYIEEIQLNIASSVFSISPLEGDNDIKPGESVEFTISYDPNTYESNQNKVVISSNDPRDYKSYVYIEGSGDAPVINIDPPEYDFGNTLVGCEETVNITISNIGNVDLVIDRIDYFITYPADFGIYDYENEHGPLPWVILPGESVELSVFYYPTDVDVDYGRVEVHSNDPATPVVDASQVATGVYAATYEETFEQDEIEAVDILFVVDNSCSMTNKQTQLADNFGTFMNVFQTSGIDYHIGFITTDSHSMKGDLITNSTVDPIGDVAHIISNIGINGSAIEKGIKYAYDALQAGYDFGPGSLFWRNDAKLIVIFVSDEDDYGSVMPVDFKTYVIAVKGSADFVTAHAVAGDYPDGCTGNGGASEGYKYYTLVSELNGNFLSICMDDWGTPIETLANESILKNTFTLTENAVQDTIYVEVDGIESSDWTYDAITNSISFNSGYTPLAGATIYVSYNPISDCTWGK